jgi:hypothetical protein
MKRVSASYHLDFKALLDFGAAYPYPLHERTYHDSHFHYTLETPRPYYNVRVADLQWRQPVGAGPIGIAITPALAPTNKGECKNGGFKNFGPPVGPFKNQGQCIKHVLSFP